MVYRGSSISMTTQCGPSRVGGGGSTDGERIDRRSEQLKLVHVA